MGRILTFDCTSNRRAQRARVARELLEIDQNRLAESDSAMRTLRLPPPPLHSNGLVMDMDRRAGRP
jgi:hypothetical protein